MEPDKAPARPARADPEAVRFWRFNQPAVAAGASPDARSELDQATRRQLEQIARARTGRFRFPGELEQRFQRFVRESNRVARLSISLLTLVLFVSAPWWSPLVLGLPDASKPYTTMVCLAVVAPVFAVASLLQYHKAQSEWTEWFLMLAFLLEVAAIELMRYATQRAGFFITPAITATVPVCFIPMAQLRFSRCVVFGAGYVGVMIASALLLPYQLGMRDPSEWLTELILIVTAIAATAFSKLATRRAWASNLLLDTMAAHDALTGLPNRTAFEQHFELMTNTAQREKKPMLLALVDLDHFKLVNDSYGHAYGDGVLNEIGLLLGEFARRSSDIAARLGGEEFALLLYDCSLDGARTRLNELLNMVRELNIEHKQNAAGVITVSIGATSVVPGAQLAEVYHVADDMLYRVKRAGRNHLCLADDVKG
ncbi:MAG TPA: GGDEF domain-containing protein [Nevskiaceae bacterium]|nr:GGDEF domain-containing protein [Nevskiaceae bacterium]